MDGVDSVQQVLLLVLFVLHFFSYRLSHTVRETPKAIGIVPGRTSNLNTRHVSLPKKLLPQKQYRGHHSLILNVLRGRALELCVSTRPVAHRNPKPTKTQQKITADIVFVFFISLFPIVCRIFCEGHPRSPGHGTPFVWLNRHPPVPPAHVPLYTLATTTLTPTSHVATQ